MPRCSAVATAAEQRDRTKQPEQRAAGFRHGDEAEAVAGAAVPVVLRQLFGVGPDEGGGGGEQVVRLIAILRPLPAPLRVIALPLVRKWAMFEPPPFAPPDTPPLLIMTALSMPAGLCAELLMELAGAAWIPAMLSSSQLVSK